MFRTSVALALLVSGSAATAASGTTAFTLRPAPEIFIRTLPAGGPGGELPVVHDRRAPASMEWSPAASTVPSRAAAFALAAAARLGERWGRVTSTWRSVAHNRAVGGARNSYHLRGRAIDIARRPGVSHWQIAAAFRAAGYRLIESLDEGDHSHFAFAGSGEAVAPAMAQRAAAPSAEVTQWHIVYAPGGSN